MRGKQRAHRGVCDAGVSCTYLGLLSPSRVASAAASPLANELERPAGVVAPLARQGLGTTLPQAVAEPAHEREWDHASSRRASVSWRETT
jgi:hypothetical protein